MFLKIRNTAAVMLGKALFNGSVFFNRFAAQDTENQTTNEKCKRSFFRFVPLVQSSPLSARFMAPKLPTHR